LLEIVVVVENCQSWFHFDFDLFVPANNEESRMTPKVTDFCRCKISVP
jgi:hypothetical protein